MFANDLKVGELYIAIPIALLILAFVFGTLAFLMPFMLAAFAIPVTLGIIWIFANFMELTTYLQNLVMLIGLGIAIDYSLLVVYRYREELRAGIGRTRRSYARCPRPAAQWSSAAAPSPSALPRCCSCRCRSCVASASAAS